MNFLEQKNALTIIMEITSMFSIIKSNVDSNPTVRSKRLIWGTPLTDSQSPFNSPRWFANIYWGSTWNRFRMDWIRKRGTKIFGEPTPSPVGHWCGGSMLTPQVVGTAAHCISDIVEKNETFDGCVRRNGWENYFAVFVGYFTEQDMRVNPIPGSFAWSKKFLVHENCGIIVHRLGGVRSGYQSETHDYGLMILDSDITFPKPGTRVVPAYDMSDMATEFQYINQRESICLVIGFGSYFWKSRGVYGDQSPIMMHGWRSMRNYHYCTSLVPIGPRWMAAIGYDFHRVFTDICHTFFGKVRVQTMPGDSGGPVTCNNIYVGLNSRGTHVDKFKGPNPDATISTAWAAATAYVMEWHSAQYRDSFLLHLKEGIAIPEVLTTEGPKPKQPLKPGVIGYFHQQLNGPSPLRSLGLKEGAAIPEIQTKIQIHPGRLKGSSISLLSQRTALPIAVVLIFYQFEILV